MISFFGVLVVATTIYSEVVSQVNGGNASVKTEVTNVVNGNTTKVESREPGTIKIIIKNGETQTQIEPQVSATISASFEPGATVAAEIEKKTQEIINNTVGKIVQTPTIFENLRQHLRDFLNFLKL